MIPRMCPATTRSLQQTARVFQALADQTRLQIIECLRVSEQCVCDLTEIIKAQQSRLSFHLRILKEAGLISDRREGRWIYYSLNVELVEDLEETLKNFKHSERAPKGARSRCSE
jgi:ArsR family transcriptional regulator, arsenate/arsenite/antimonite-responsive transcriptional repressor